MSRTRITEDELSWWKQHEWSSRNHLSSLMITLWAVASLLLLETVSCEEHPSPTMVDLKKGPPEELDHRARALRPLDLNLSVERYNEAQPSRWRRSSPDLISPRSNRWSRKRSKSSQDCHLERKEMRVKDLGLGYDSDETVIFKYCVGMCHSFRRNYDLVLKSLMDNKSISGKKVSSAPCCRPTRYETITFMDSHTAWQVIKWLSAANCSCVG